MLYYCQKYRICKQNRLSQILQGFIMENIEIIKSPEEVNSRILELGTEITNACGSTPLTMIVVMNGGLFFAAKLAEAIDLDDFYPCILHQLLHRRDHFGPRWRPKLLLGV